jgi:flagellar biosynthesis/type III secretory pathway protein FliH
MGARHWKSLLVAASACLALAAPASAQGFGDAAYDRGYREGVQQGERDGRDGHAYAIESNRIYRDGDRGYERRDGSRDSYRNDFRRGFSSGYRDGYDRVRVNSRNGAWGREVQSGQWPRDRRGYQEPAFARGYSDGWQQGADDGRDRDRYDPVRHGDYKDGDNGYERSYGSKDAYKNNYRSGFRQGYEEGYRSGTRTARR